MEPQELADILSRWCRDAPEGEHKTVIHLFGIVYADEMGRGRASVSEVVRRSEIKNRFTTEVYNGKRLARYVTVRPDCDFAI